MKKANYCRVMLLRVAADYQSRPLGTFARRMRMDGPCTEVDRAEERWTNQMTMTRSHNKRQSSKKGKGRATALTLCGRPFPGARATNFLLLCSCGSRAQGAGCALRGLE